MKWGVRRYQNEDGTLTPAGKARAEKRAKKEAIEKISQQHYDQLMSDIREHYSHITLGMALGNYFKNVSPTQLLRKSFGEYAFDNMISAMTVEALLNYKIHVGK